MAAKLPKTVAAYVEAYNARDREATAVCFLEHALVHDEGKNYQGRKAIGDWIGETIEKYQPILTPGKVEGSDPKTVIAMTVSGSFPGSPVRLSFRFIVEDGGIVDLDIAPQ
jgi:hypothetical protein